jgi:hypothetical protein
MCTIEGGNSIETYSGLQKYSPPLGIFPIFFALQTGIKIYFLGVFVSFDLHNMPTTLKMQNSFYCETNKK